MVESIKLINFEDFKIPNTSKVDELRRLEVMHYAQKKTERMPGIDMSTTDNFSEHFGLVVENYFQIIYEIIIN